MPHNPLHDASSATKPGPRSPIPAWIDWLLVVVAGFFLVLLLVTAVAWFLRQLR